MLYLISASIILLVQAWQVNACCDNAFPHAPPPNQGFATFVFNTTLPSTHYLIPGDHFYKQVLQWDETEQKEFKEEADNFFMRRFGIITTAENSDINQFMYQTNPQADMRCVILSDEQFIPTEGFKVQDAGWMVMVVNPKGIVLGGEFEGMIAPYGTTFSIGHWRIERVDKAGTARQPLLWKSQHAAPGGQAVVGASMMFSGEMDVISEEWGHGKSLHIAKYAQIQGTDKTHAILRNTITF